VFKIILGLDPLRRDGRWSFVGNALDASTEWSYPSSFVRPSKSNALARLKAGAVPGCCEPGERDKRRLLSHQAGFVDVSIPPARLASLFRGPRDVYIQQKGH
jgi:hypothetical protein